MYVLSCGQQLPASEAAAVGAAAKLDAAAALPARTHEIEPERRAHGSAAGDGQTGEAHVCRPGHGGGTQQERPGEEDAQTCSHDRGKARAR